MLQVPSAVERLSLLCKSHGGRAYIVGGSVRDHFLKKPIKDWDIEVFGLALDELEGLLRTLGTVDLVGKSFGVLKWRPRGHRHLGEIDVSIPRRDSNKGPGHRGIEVIGDPSMTIEEAARRRDLTVNAMMWDIDRGELVDPFSGLADLQEGHLRAVDSQTFLEDPLRALRAVQFSARMNLVADDELVALCRRADLHELPAERVLAEWAKLLLRGVNLTLGIGLARQTEVLHRCLPEFVPVQEEALESMIRWRDQTNPNGRRLAMMWLAWSVSLSEESLATALDRVNLQRFEGFPAREVLTRAHEARGASVATLADLKALSRRVDLRVLLPVVSPEAFVAAKEHELLDGPPKRWVMGRDLMKMGAKPGPHMGTLLEELFVRQLDGRLANEEQAREFAQQRLQLG